MNIEDTFNKIENKQNNKIFLNLLKENISNMINDIIFTQKRVGKNGKIIKVFKIRTMEKDAEKQVPIETIYGNKQVNDTRIIRSRKWMRKSGVDELPQILNILKGEMSVFGSRPTSINVYNILTNTQKERRGKYKPGVFGGYAFYNKGKKAEKRNMNKNQDIYLKIRSKKEKEGIMKLFKYNTYIFIENIKALLNGVNK